MVCEAAFGRNKLLDMDISPSKCYVSESPRFEGGAISSERVSKIPRNPLSTYE